ncbi:MAG: hypothetical protein RL472_1221, partial [Pseudomonadota bacterium]
LHVHHRLQHRRSGLAHRADEGLLRGGDEGVVIEPADPTIWVSDSQTSRAGAVLTTVTEMVASSGAPFALDRSALRLTVLGGAQAVEINGCPAP